MKQSLDETFDNITQMNDSDLSSVASQMSNMHISSKFVKIITGLDKASKAKSKVSSGQHDSGSSWSLLDDETLVVLVHDLGPNWELVSDAINNTFQYKFIFRKPEECKERHRILMGGNARNGADRAHVSWSSQSYPSAIPGIPKGQAEHLFKRMQGPMEEDTLKSRFHKIIKIGKRHHYLRNQNDNQDLKQVVPPHKSHAIALSQVSYCYLIPVTARSIKGE